MDPIKPSGGPRAPCSDFIRTEVGFAGIFGDFERFFSLLISPSPDLLAIYSGDDDRVFRLCGEGEEPELREDPDDLLLLSDFSLRPLLLCWFLLLERDLGDPGILSLSLEEEEREYPDE